MIHLRRHRPAAGFTMIEVLVGLAIMLAGLLAIAAYFPILLSSQRDAELLTIAASLAQMKAEEVRRDNDQGDQLVAEIRALTTPTDPIAFINEPRLSYSFSGISLQYGGLDASDPRATPGVARVLIRKSPLYDADQEVVYELRFD